MKVAMALFGTRVSPRFDCAPGFEVIEISDGDISARTHLDTRGMAIPDRLKKLAELGVETLICGGIDARSAEQLEFSGIKIYSWVTGEAEDALSCLLEGQLESGLMMGEGGRCCGRWHFGARSVLSRGCGGSRRRRGRRGPSQEHATEKGGDQYAER